MKTALLIEALDILLRKLNTLWLPLVKLSEQLKYTLQSLLKYLRCAIQNVHQAFNGLPDTLILCRTFFLVDDQQLLRFM